MAKIAKLITPNKNKANKIMTWPLKKHGFEVEIKNLSLKFSSNPFGKPFQAWMLCLCESMPSKYLKGEHSKSFGVKAGGMARR